MKYNYHLVFVERNGKKSTILIRNSLKSIDEITSDYENSFDMINTFNELYGKKIDFVEAKILAKSQDNNIDTIKEIRILYAKDKINKDEIKLALIDYLKKNPKEIDKLDIKYVKKYFDETIENYYELLVGAYFKDNSYSKYRKMYFELKDRNVLSYTKKENNSYVKRRQKE